MIACREQIQILTATLMRSAPHMQPHELADWAVEMLETSGYTVPPEPKWTRPPWGPQLAVSDGVPVCNCYTG